ncbi:TonB-dependent receptor [Sphingomonas sp. Y38-1Y]|uniref:TonB-dependent receptor n=1 Tax=Sphingomonas sp. Y38-1Y TaxID=3078265 RepID=UPI0028E21089|nr:TonB-dependent receptor [Sphingomonas sp. Y38-1Y]
MKRQLWATASALVMMHAAPAMAQVSGETAEAATDPSGTDPDAFADVVVTARRREENLQDVPVAVTAFTPAVLVQKAITDRTSLADNTPSLFTINGGYPREFAFFALRGQGPAFGSTPGVINYFAEVPNTTSIDGRVGTYYDLANVQVVSGPQGTLFGKNATGGNILFEPAKPRNAFEGYVRAEYGNYNNARIEGALNLPVVPDKVLLRVAGEVGRRDGYTIDVGPNFAGKDYDNLAYQSVRLGLTLRPADGIESYTVARYYNSDTNGGGTVLGAVNPAGAALIGLFYPTIGSQLADQQGRGPRRVSYDLNQRSLTDYWQVVNQTSIDLGDTLKLRNIASYSEFRSKYTYDYDATPLPLAGQVSRGIPVLAPNTFTEELQLQGTAANRAINFSIGGYLDRQTWSGPAGIQEFTLFPVGTLIPPVPFFQVLKNRSEAVFGQATVDLGVLTPALRGLSLTGGLRYTWEHSFTATTLIAPPAVEGTFDDDYLSYTATIDYDVSSGIHVYLTSRDAYKSGGVNGPVPEGSAFRVFPAERLSDIEAGLKAQFDVGTMKGRLNVAAYRGNYDNIQRTTAEQVSGVVLNVTRSAAKGRVQGVEINAALIPFTGLTLNGSYSYIDARYTEVADASAGAILNGAPFPYTPEHKFSVGGTYEAPLGRAGDLTLSANYVRQTEVSTAQTNQSFYRELPGYGLLNASVGLNNVGGRPLSITAFGTNLTNVAKPVGVIDLYAAGPSVVGLTYTEPRMYGIRVGYRFGN